MTGNKYLKILILNWRDIKNPLSGGAEVLTHEMAKRWVMMGHKVVMFSSGFNGAKDNENIDGVDMYRGGSPNIFSGKLPVHLAALFFYKKNMKGKIDVVIDEIHGIPFFTPLYVKEKKIALICEVAREIWDRMFPFPVNLVGKMAEKFYFLFYKNIHFLTISESTKKDLIEEGINNSLIRVLPMGFNGVKIDNIKKEKDPTLIFVGRLNPMKGVEDAIKAFCLAYKKIENLKLWIIGRGEEKYVSYLKNIIKRNKIEKNVLFFGFVTEKEKFEAMAKAHIIVVPSLKEGFGLIVPEAASVGTPSIVYDVEGLRDLVEDGVNGLKVKKNNYIELSKNIVKLFDNKSLYDKLKFNAKESSKLYNWDNTADSAMEEIIK